VDYTGWAMEDAVVDASAQAGFQGIGTPTVLIANNIEVAAMKKSLGGKIEYERPGSTAGVHGFSKVTIEGDNGPIEILGDPFMKRNRAYLLKLDEFSIKSLGAWPHLGELDGLKFQRLSNADAYEVRFVSYGNTRCKNPGPHVYLQNFGA
jgi:hypothetical protein